MKKLLALLLSFALTLTPINIFAFNDFSDVAKEHFAYESIVKLRDLGITDGVGNNRFGIGNFITESEFATYLIELLDLKTNDFEDELSSKKNITNEKAVLIIIEALGYNELATQLTYLKSPFSDVIENKQYIAMASDFGIISQTQNKLFKPSDLLSREEAAVMLINTYDRLNNKLDFINGFYAIRSSNQSEFIKNLNSTSFGWSKLEFSNNTLILNTSTKNNNEYYIPIGYTEPLIYSSKSLLNIMPENKYINSELPLSSYIVTNPKLVDNTINLILKAIKYEDIEFDGVVIDFENMKGEEVKEAFNDFLRKLKDELDELGKIMYVAVPPQRKDGLEYFDGYDYRTIGRLADKVILMAHDYNAKSLSDKNMENGVTLTPLTPIDEIYYALKMITDKNVGVEDKSKILLQISYSTAQWKLKDNKVINKYPYTPAYETLYQRIEKGANLNYSTRYENPYLSFFDENDSTDNIVWYENSQSVSAKIKLAKLFGLEGISIWRLGNIPTYQNDDAVLWNR